MDLLTELLRILLTISNTLLYPVIIALVVLIFVCLMMTGNILSEYSRRSKDLEDKIFRGSLSSFYKKMKQLHIKYKNKKVLIIELERLVQKQEMEFEKKLEKTRLLIRVGPILGLMGTLIPMGPALLGLSAGNIDQMANQLVIAFASTVVGLFVGGISLIVTTVRRRWYMEDMKDVEYMAEKLMTENKLIGDKK